MTNIKLEDCKADEIQNLLNTRKELLFVAEKKFDTDLLSIINKQCERNIRFSLRPNRDDVSIELLNLIPNIQRLIISPAYENRLETLSELSSLTNLIELTLGMYVKGNISFEPIKHIDTLVEFNFGDQGLEHKTQYEFVNLQQHLEKLHIKTLDLSLISKNISLIDLYIHHTLRNENLLAERFPNLKKFCLHGDSRRQDHSFIQDLSQVEEISINYNSYLTSFPKMKAPKKVKRIRMLECSNFSDIDSLLEFENLETLCLTAHNKSLQVTESDFVKLKQLTKLTTVYTSWGRTKTPESVEKLYKETGWKNSMK